jgi:hypothetical protein
MRQLPNSCSDRYGVFSHSEARAAGWTRSALAHAVASGAVRRLRPGVFAAPFPVPESRHAAARYELVIAAFGAALSNPMGSISHGPAAVVHGIPVWRHRRTPCLTVPPGFVGDIEGAHLHRARLPEGHRILLHLVPVTSVARTIIDIGREHGPLAAVVAADAALHSGKVDTVTLRDRLAECRGWPGVRAAREAINFADERSESPLESASRYQLNDLVPAPEPQARIYDSSGMLLGRTDFLWERFGVVGEVDGLEKYDDPERESLRSEKIRQERLERAGLIVVRWGRADLEDIPRLVARLKDAFARGQQVAGPRAWHVLRRPTSA